MDKLASCLILAAHALGVAAGPLWADSIAVTNPSFQADAFSTWPGYLGGGNPAGITGWGGGSGINGTDLGAGTPFADNGAIPDGTRVAFIQGSKSLTQTLGGFEIGQTYWLQLWTNARSGSGDVPKVNVTLGGKLLLAPTVLRPVGGAAPYYLANFSWTATATTALLAIGSAPSAGGDAAAVFDAVAMIKRGAGEVVLANPSFEASGTHISPPGFYPTIAGWERTGSGLIGVNTSTGPFHDNGIVPDGANVLLLQANAGVQQGLVGLAPGGTYRLTLRYNSRAASAAPTFRVTVAGQSAFDGAVSPVGVGQPYHTLSFDFTASDGTALLGLENLATAAESTVLVDNVSLAALGAPPAPLVLAQPGLPGSAGGIVTFNEIHYHPAALGAPEWIEIVNQFGTRLDLGGWQLTGGVGFIFPEGTLLEPGAFMVISGTPATPPGALGPFTGRLDGAGDTLRLRTRQGWLVDELNYGVSGDWPNAPDGSGPTLAKRAPSFASSAATSWTVSSQTGGTPGAGNFATLPATAMPAAPVANSIVISEIHYHARPTYADPNRAIAYAENPAEFVELHNRGDTAVSLDGWQLDDAINYPFPPGTTLAPGAFRVVDQTQYSGSLGNAGDTIKLRDASGGIVDQVRYRSRGRWSAYADGGGASLELIDPAADNTRPEAWAASDESGKLGWQTYTYTALGAEPPGSNNPANWHEFLLGLLDSGEILIDDLSVRKDPGGANTEIIQNGTFESDVLGQPPLKWRCLGTHKLSAVVPNPSGAGKVLKVVATDGIEHTYNNCSTTLVGNQALDPTKTYRVSFRAKWLVGSPQLNTRLYLNRAARTTILPQPVTTGTPGAANSRRLANAGPTFTEFTHSPLVPAPGQPVSVFVRPHDPDGLGTHTLFFSVNGGGFSQVAMADTGAGVFSAQIPGQPLAGMVVQFYVSGADGRGAIAAFPAAGPASRALYRIGDGGVAAIPLTNKLRLIMRPDDAVTMHNPIHAVSNFRWPATLIANDREVFYDVRVRLRSSAYGRQGYRTGWNLDFDPEQPFRGTELDMALDGAFNMPAGNGSGFLENSLGASVNELLYHRIAERAGGIAAEIDDVCYLATPYYESRRAQLRLRRYGNSALDEFTPHGGDGSLFKQELIYYPNSTVDGNPESLKNAYNAVLPVDIITLGADKEAYRFNYLPQNHASRDDFAGIFAMTSAFSQANANLYAASAAALDLESWTRVLALNALTGLADTYNQHLPHNLQFLTRPSDGRVMLLPWDMDFAMYFAPDFSIYGGGAHRVADLINDARVKRRMAGQLLDFCQNGFSNSYLDPWIDHYCTLTAKPAYAANFKSWVAARRSFVLAQLASDWPATPFAITTNGGSDFSLASPTAMLRGTGWINLHAIRMVGALAPLAVTWLDGSQWELVVPLGAGATAITLEGLDHQGAVVGSDQIVITSTSPTVPAAAGNLVISELMYHPADPNAAERAAGFVDSEEFEFIEILNVGTLGMELQDASFTVGITYTFPNVLLAPGARLLLAANAAAFVARYGATSVPLGTYTGTLNNAGERLLLLDRAGVPILDFTYDDTTPWPAEADGVGFSLTLIHPSANPNPGTAANWRVSASPTGSPGTSDALSPGGFARLLDYALASLPSATVENGYATFTWRQRIGADSAALVPQLTSDLATWQPDPGDGAVLVPLGNSVNFDGTRTLRVRSAMPVNSARREFFRLQIQLAGPPAN